MVSRCLTFCALIHKPEDFLWRITVAFQVRCERVGFAPTLATLPNVQLGMVAHGRSSFCPGR